VLAAPPAPRAGAAEAARRASQRATLEKKLEAVLGPT
jgi:hypothetical protein